MTDAQKRFCDEYLVDFNATRAYKVAYPGCKKDETASAAGSRMLGNVNVQKYIEERQKELQEETNVTQQKVINELAKIAFLDIRKLYNDNGGLKNIQDIDDKTAGAIASLETIEEFDGSGEERVQIGYAKKIKLLDKTKALELLGKHLGIFVEKVEIGQDKPFEVNITVRK